MPLVRSVENIPSNVDREPHNSTVSLEQGAGDGIEIPARPSGRPRTRLQTRKEPVEDNQVRRVVDESLTEFRNEVISMIEDGFRHLSLSNQEHRRQEGPHDSREQINRDNDEGGDRDARHVDRDSDRNSERVLNIIRNWRIRFTGDTSEFTIDEFIYRINTLTAANLRGNYNLLCEHAHILFEGKALKWYWRFHRSVGEIDWRDLCEALKRQYKDFDTDYDIKDEILRRKQKCNRPLTNITTQFWYCATNLERL